MIEYRKARPEEFDDMVAFANFVFNHKGDPIAFQHDLSKVYGHQADRDYAAAMHTLAVDDASGIRALIGAMPGLLHTPAGDLATRYVGTVSVHPQARGEGHMKRILSSIVQQAREEGVDLLLLGGQRQRYGYFGFAPAGAHYSAEIVPGNLRHALKGVDASDVCFRRVEVWDAALCREAFEYYQRRPLRFERPLERFAERCQSYGRQLWLAQAGEETLGYVVSSRDKSEWSEFECGSPAALEKIILAWAGAFGLGGFTIELPLWDRPRVEQLGAFAETLTLQAGIMACVLSPVRVLRTLLESKAALMDVEDGQAVLPLRDRTLTVSVTSGQAQVLEEPAENPDGMDDRALSQLLCCPWPYAGRPAVPNTWFPLPIFATEPDSF